MEPSELLRRFIEVLDRLGIPYLITGSVDYDYIKEWANKLGLGDTWREVLERTAKPT